jgi:hypothetical protein
MGMERLGQKLARNVGGPGECLSGFLVGGSEAHLPFRQEDLYVLSGGHS